MTKKSITVGTDSTPSQISSPKRKVRDAVESIPTNRTKSSALLDTRVVYCGDNLKQLGPCRTGQCWGEKEKRALEDRHENTKAYLDYLRPRCVPPARR